MDPTGKTRVTVGFGENTSLSETGTAGDHCEAIDHDMIFRGSSIRSDSGRHATLDTDGFFEGRIVFSAPAVREHLHAIHGVIGASFKAAVTEHAFNVWKEA
ncbi:hypothetical protein XH94_30800 [Bradyrhizobium zhanjiangense]|uniref:Uncharacterized protein n=1 Tax=Bradyrhizobium zhanjiangense TaxID=1325107 RepID=A0A4Q0SD52_9BRAD|nr:hypothetical protein XH94_30800 [Bradyrhizobium zhanjiangense]